MGRITVSLPESLKATLKAHANQHDLTTSKVVALALEAYFQGEPPPQQEPPAADLGGTQRYLGQLVAQLEAVRRNVHQIAVSQYGPFAAIPDSLSQPLPEPPWNKVPPATGKAGKKRRG